MEREDDGNFPIPEPPEYVEDFKDQPVKSVDCHVASLPRAERKIVFVLPNREEVKSFKKAIREHLRDRELARVEENVRALGHPREPKGYEWKTREDDVFSTGNCVREFRGKEPARIRVRRFRNVADFDGLGGSVGPEDCVAVLVRKMGPDGKKLKRAKSKVGEKAVESANKKPKYYPQRVFF